MVNKFLFLLDKSIVILGYHTWKKENGDKNPNDNQNIRSRSKTSPNAKESPTNTPKKHDTMTRSGGDRLNKINRVISSLMEAITSTTPKYRFVAFLIFYKEFFRHFQ